MLTFDFLQTARAPTSSSASSPASPASPATRSTSRTSRAASTMVSSTTAYVLPIHPPPSRSRVPPLTHPQAFGINARPDGKGLILSQKNPEHVQQPAKSVESFPYATAKPARQTYKAIVDGTTRSGYRSDLRAVAVARASAIRKSQTVKKDVPAPKARGKKALSKAIAESS